MVHYYHYYSMKFGFSENIDEAMEQDPGSAGQLLSCHACAMCLHPKSISSTLAALSDELVHSHKLNVEPDGLMDGGAGRSESLRLHALRSKTAEREVERVHDRQTTPVMDDDRPWTDWNDWNSSDE
jgi:hypothetical protein